MSMRARFFHRSTRGVVLASLTAVSMMPTPGAAQVGALGLGAQAGPLRHSLLGQVEGTLPGLGPNGLAVDADVEAEGSILLGGRLTWGLRPAVDLRLRVARASTHMRLFARTVPVGGTGTQNYPFDGLGDVVVWIADVDVAWRPWRPYGAIAPYVFVGAGVSNWDISGLDDLGALPPLLESPVNLSPVNAFLPGVAFGLGLTLGPWGPWRIELEAADHVSGDPLDDDDFHIGTEFVGFGRAKDLVHNLSFTAGVRVTMGR